MRDITEEIVPYLVKDWPLTDCFYTFLDTHGKMQEGITQEIASYDYNRIDRFCAFLDIHGKRQELFPTILVLMKSDFFFFMCNITDEMVPFNVKDWHRTDRFCAVLDTHGKMKEDITEEIVSYLVKDQIRTDRFYTSLDTHDKRQELFSTILFLTKSDFFFLYV